MWLKSHRLIGVIRIEPPVLEIGEGEDDDSTIGGLLASFAQRSLLAGDSCRPRWSAGFVRRCRTGGAATQWLVPANLKRLAEDLEHELALLNDAVA